MMDEEVLAGLIGRDEAVALVVAEPFHGSSCHTSSWVVCCEAREVHEQQLRTRALICRAKRSALGAKSSLDLRSRPNGFSRDEAVTGSEQSSARANGHRARLLISGVASLDLLQLGQQRLRHPD